MIQPGTVPLSALSLLPVTVCTDPLQQHRAFLREPWPSLGHVHQHEVCRRVDAITEFDAEDRGLSGSSPQEYIALSLFSAISSEGQSQGTPP